MNDGQQLQDPMQEKLADALLSRTLDDFPNPIWRAGVDNRRFYFNRAWQAFTGRSVEQESGNGWTEGMHPDDLEHCRRTIAESFAARRPIDLRYRLRHRSGEYRTMAEYASPVFDLNGHFAGYVGSCYDVNEKVELEMQLQTLRERNSLVAKLSAACSLGAGFCHELNNPLTIVKGNVSLCLSELRNESVRPEVLLRRLGMALDGVERISEVVDRLRGVVTRTLAEKKRLDLRNEVRTVVENHLPYAVNQQTSIEFQAPAEAMPVSAISIHVHTIVATLLQNCLHATKKVEGRPRSIVLSVAGDAESVVLVVRDNGRGTDLAECATTPHFTRDPSHGLGLALVNVLVSDLGGSLTATSRVDEGTEFVVRLPREHG